MLSKLQVDVWCLSTSDVDAPLQNHLRTFLTEEEKAAVARFMRPNDRVLNLCARAFLRVILSRYKKDVKPIEWVFNKNKYGKPFISNKIDGEPLYFNISHTKGKVVCAIAPHEYIGVDVESIERSIDSLKLAESVFAKAEIQALRDCAPQGRNTLFYRFWTLKESYIKAIGMGLSHPLDNFWFDLTQEKSIKLNFTEGANVRTGSFYQKLLDDDYMLALGVVDSGDIEKVNLHYFSLSDFY